MYFYVKVARANELPRIQKQFETLSEDPNLRKMMLAQATEGDHSLLIWASDRKILLTGFFDFKEVSQSALPENAVRLLGDETVFKAISQDQVKGTTRTEK